MHRYGSPVLQRGSRSHTGRQDTPYEWSGVGAPPGPLETVGRRLPRRRTAPSPPGLQPTTLADSGRDRRDGEGKEERQRSSPTGTPPAVGASSAPRPLSPRFTGPRLPPTGAGTGRVDTGHSLLEGEPPVGPKISRVFLRHTAVEPTDDTVPGPVPVGRWEECEARVLSQARPPLALGSVGAASTGGREWVLSVDRVRPLVTSIPYDANGPTTPSVEDPGYGRRTHTTTSPSGSPKVLPETRWSAPRGKDSQVVGPLEVLLCPDPEPLRVYRLPTNENHSPETEPPIRSPPVFVSYF